jgi:MFS transporter, DHA3 family, macrolide efflux protein
MPIFKEASKGLYTSYYMIIMTVLGFMLAMANIPIMVLMQKLIPDNLRGRVFGLIGTTTMIMMPLGTFFSGILLDVLPVYIIPLTGGVLLTVRLFFFACNKEMQHL